MILPTRTSAFSLLLSVLSVSSVLNSASATDWQDQTIPGKWLKQVAPENAAKLTLPTYLNDFEKAKAEIFAGRYHRGLMMLRNDNSVAALNLKGQALAAIGREDDALKILTVPGTEVQRARVLNQLGQYPQARDLLQKLDTPSARYELGHTYELLGDLDSAKKTYAWFATTYLQKWRDDQERGFDDAALVTTIGQALDRWALLTNAYADDASLHNTIMNMFVKAYDVIDRTYWPAHLAAAQYLFSHDDQPKTKEELKVVHLSNPSDAQALELIAKLNLQEFNFDGVDAVVDALHNVKPHSQVADLIETRNLLLQRLPIEAEAPVQRVLEKQPNNLEALGLLAAAKALQTHDDEAQAVLKRVEKIDPDNASAYVEVAEALSAMRQYPRAIAMYKIAVQRAPWWTEARNGLGLLYTQSGDEADAHATLDAAHKVDPFNLKTTNYLRLLDKLATFAKAESPHFIVFYDAKTDPVIPLYFSKYLETVYTAVTKDFACEPPVKTYIEVFPTHDEFSVRTTGTPWIGTVGASTGRVIALVAPRRAAKTMGPFNWSQVLRHEFTHTVTLAATENRIPHWMTEGLAVSEEQTPLRWEWVPMLYSAVKNDTLFPLDKLTWAFVRPKRPSDRSLAYAESFWLCQYIEQKWGHHSILKMLDDFRAGKRQEDVFTDVLKISQSQLYSDFLAWAKQQTATWGYDEETTKKYQDLTKQGQELIDARQYKEALAIWQQIAKLRPVDELPHRRLAGLYLTKDVNEPESAVKELMLISQMELKDNQYAKRAARVLRNAEKYDHAEFLAQQAIYIDPYDKDAHELMAEIAEKKGDTSTADQEKKVLSLFTETKPAD